LKNTPQALLWLLVAIYAAARLTQAFPERLPMLAIAALHVLPPLTFAMLHGWQSYGLRAMAVFFLLCFAVGMAFEHLSIFTGFPFGHYHFTSAMGPKLFEVPVLLGLAYIGMGYLSWTLGGIIVGNGLFARPFISGFIMVAWDLAMDPIWANFAKAWLWRDGGAYFGVPLSNFFGWYLTIYVIYQSFAFYVRGTRPAVSRPAIAFYAVSALGNLLVAAPAGVSTVTDPGGAQWSVAAIRAASVLVSIFAMGAFAAMAWVRCGVSRHTSACGLDA
jgi:putative membrane protein